MSSSQTVAILGASEKEGRYARMAQELLIEYGHKVIPIAAKAESILGVPAVAEIKHLNAHVDTLTVYVGTKNIAALVDDMLASKIQRFIFNPGTECPISIYSLRKAGKTVVEGCTLVMLKTGQF